MAARSSGKTRSGKAARRKVAAKPGPERGSQGVLLRAINAFTAGMTDRVAASGVAGLLAGRALLLSPEAARMRREAGRTVRELRELAGLTVDELAAAIDLSDHSVLAAVEKGTATLSFELILRLSALLARNDPVPFVAKLTRSYNPVLWKLLEGWGISRVPLQLERERRFVNVYRSRDDARELSDAAFDHVLRFTQAAFEMALDFATREEGRKRSPKRRAAGTRSKTRAKPASGRSPASRSKR